jgi:hypothetical protein
MVGAGTSWFGTRSIHQSNTQQQQQGKNNGVVVGFETPTSIINQPPPHNTTISFPTPPRFLLGIFTHDLYKMEKDRRQSIRNTYLRYYKDGHDELSSSNRICSLTDIVNDNHQVQNWKKDDCQLAYTFVRGHANQTTGRTELLNETHSSRMLLTSSTTTTTSDDETDMLSFHIDENGEYGKSITWFRYATLWIQEHPDFPVDYIVKMDSDALLIPHRFFRWIEEQEEALLLHHHTNSIDSTTTSSTGNRNRIYGGVPMDKMTCGWPHHDHCNQLQAPLYMGGALYLVSVDLADYVTSQDCPRSKLFVPHEDMAMANYVYSNQKKGSSSARMITNFSHPEAYLNTWKHPVKDPKRMKTLWRKFLSSKRKRQQQQRNNNNNNHDVTGVAT